MILLHFILLVLFCYIALGTGYNLLFAVGGLFGGHSLYSHTDEKRRFAILIPTYKEDHIIIQTVKNALSQNYPKDKFDIIVIADQLQLETLAQLEELPIQLLTVSFEKSTKAKSLKFAIQRIHDTGYDIVMILDADNLMGDGCLEKTNHAFSKGFQMVQLHRTAKNKNTSTAILDAVSEEIGNHILRRGHRALGLSASLIGSGMAFNYKIFKSALMDLNIENNPAEDREINAEMLKKRLICEYIPDALVYDEKVQSGQVLEKQRTRWISAQLQYCRRFWVKEFKKTFSYNIHYFDYALQTLLLPRVMLLMVSFFMAIFSLFVYVVTGTGIYPGIILWLSLFMGCIISLIISIYPYISAKEAIKGLWSLPTTFWAFFKAFIKSRSGQQEFIHTPKEFIK